MIGPITPEEKREQFVPLLGAIVATAPFVLCLPQFRRLFWFGDEWDLLAQLRRAGLLGWAGAFSAEGIGENFIPLFKFAWGGAVLATRGSYLLMLAILWLAHALNVLLLGYILRRCGFRPAAIATALVFAGLPASNIEALGWTIQFSQVFSFSCFLLGLLALLRLSETPQRRGLHFGIAILAAAAGILTFSRGVLGACLLAAAALLFRGPGLERWRSRLSIAAAFFLTGAAGAILITRTAPGNHQHLLAAGMDTLQSIAHFGLAFLLLNPLQALLRLGEPTTTQMVVVGAIKIALVILALASASGTKRALLLLMVALDMTNAVLVALGRYHTGLAATVGSRYQYVPLFCLAPVLAFHFERVLGLFRARAATAGVFATLLVAGLVAWPWPRDMRWWSDWRGEGTRAALRDARGDMPVPYDPGVTVATARELVTRYKLH